MKDVFLVYDTSCFYEIVVLNYFLSVSGCEMIFCSLDGKPIKAMEGFTVNVDTSLKELDKEQIRSFIIPGGNILAIDNADTRAYLQDLKARGVLLAGICAGVDVLDNAGLLCDVKSTHTTNDDLVNDNNIITARANAYVDFAIEVAKKLNLFEDEDDLMETIAFWREFKRVE